MNAHSRSSAAPTCLYDTPPVVKNGQLNRIVLSITKPPGADRVLTLEGITGAYLDKNKLEGQKGHIVRNVSMMGYRNWRAEIGRWPSRA